MLDWLEFKRKASVVLILGLAFSYLALVCTSVIKPPYVYWTFVLFGLVFINLLCWHNKTSDALEVRRRRAAIDLERNVSTETLPRYTPPQEPVVLPMVPPPSYRK